MIDCVFICDCFPSGIPLFGVNSSIEDNDVRLLVLLQMQIQSAPVHLTQKKHAMIFCPIQWVSNLGLLLTKSQWSVSRRNGQIKRVS